MLVEPARLLAPVVDARGQPVGQLLHARRHDELGPGALAVGLAELEVVAEARGDDVGLAVDLGLGALALEAPVVDDAVAALAPLGGEALLLGLQREAGRGLDGDVGRERAAVDRVALGEEELAGEERLARLALDREADRVARGHVREQDRGLPQVGEQRADIGRAGGDDGARVDGKLRPSAFSVTASVTRASWLNSSYPTFCRPTTATALSLSTCRAPCSVEVQLPSAATWYSTVSVRLMARAVGSAGSVAPATQAGTGRFEAEADSGQGRARRLAPWRPWTAGAPLRRRSSPGRT